MSVEYMINFSVLENVNISTFFDAMKEPISNIVSIDIDSTRRNAKMTQLVRDGQDDALAYSYWSFSTEQQRYLYTRDAYVYTNAYCAFYYYNLNWMVRRSEQIKVFNYLLHLTTGDLMLNVDFFPIFAVRTNGTLILNNAVYDIIEPREFFFDEHALNKLITEPFEIRSLLPP